MLVEFHLSTSLFYGAMGIYGSCTSRFGRYP